MKNGLVNYRKLLDEFISFKSISTNPDFQPEIAKTVVWLNKQFTRNGFKVEIVKGYGNPIVIATLIQGPEFQNVLIYGHYDVQPADQGDGWKNNPFQVSEDTKRIYARGVVDNKGQVLVHISSVFDLLAEGNLKYNVQFLIEGDEETGSRQIENFFKDHYKKLKSDFILVSDGEMTGIHPCLDSSFRGAINLELIVKTSSKDNHSGLYGGAIPNAANELISLLNKLHDSKGNLTIPGINTEKKVDKAVVSNNKKIPYSLDELLEVTNAKTRFNENKMDFYTQTGFFTSAEITTLTGGYMGEGFRNAIPGKASAKINIRLAPKLTVQEFLMKFEKYLNSIKPKHVEIEITPYSSNNGFFVDTKNEVAMKAKQVLEESYGTQVYDRPCGAIIPIIGHFIKYLNVPLISVGLVNSDCNMHGVDENYRKEFLNKGLNFSRKFLSI